MTVRSFRVVFELERRLHRIDRWRLPLPYGLPLRSIGYALVTLTLILALSVLPLVGDLVGLLAPPLRLVGLPAGAAYLLTQLRLDGRPAHRALAGWARWRCSPHERDGRRPVRPLGLHAPLADLRMVPDWRSCRYRRATLDGPASVTFRYPAKARRGRCELRIRQAAERPLLRGKQLELRRGQRLVIE